jgi:hypothetical protein
MKIERQSPAQSVPAGQRQAVFKQIFKGPWWVLLVILLAFAAGAFSYRQGWFSQLLNVGKILVTEGPGQVKPPEQIKQAEVSLEDEARMYQNNGLQTLYLDVPFKSLQAIEAKREEALARGILFSSDDDLVKAKATLGKGQKMDIQMRLKGDWTDHLEGKKWSFRIHVDENDKYMLGMRQFSIQAPETRQFLKEWAFHQILIHEGIMSPRYDFVNVLINGEWRGIYALEENFAPELIEAMGRRQGVIIRFDEDLFWQNTATFWKSGVSNGLFMVTEMPSADITSFSAGKISKSSDLSKEAQTAIDNLRAFQIGKKKASEVFDVKLMGRFYALSDLWAACHSAYWNNVRFYYNPVTALLEPVVYDAEPFLCGGNTEPRQSVMQEFEGSKIFNDPEVRQAYAQELARVASKDYVNNSAAFLNKQGLQTLDLALKNEYSDDQLDIPWELITTRANNLSLELAPAAAMRGAYSPNNSNQMQVELMNLMVLPVEWTRLEVAGQSLPVQKEWLSCQEEPCGVSWDAVHSVFRFDHVKDSRAQVFLSEKFNSRVDLNAFGDQVDSLSVFAVVRLAGLEQEFKIPLAYKTLPEAQPSGPQPAAPSLEQALQQHAFLQKAEGQNLLVTQPGVWDVQGDLILPKAYSLQVSAGTTLRFEPGKIILTDGGSLNLMGSEGQPVLLTAQKDYWGGVVVLRAGAWSQWRYAQVEKTNGISRGGWIQTGSNNFFESPINLEHVSILHAETEDGINVMHAQFSFNNSEFGFTMSDAFDSDFSGGTITGCTFHDVGADAVDISSAEVTVQDTKAYSIGDKGISAGENSLLHVKNFRVENTSIGMAAKDLSRIIAQNVTIINAKNVGLTAYIKKPQFGPGYLEVNGLTVDNVKTLYMIQNGNTGLLDGKTLKTIEMNVKALYQSKFLGN